MAETLVRRSALVLVLLVLAVVGWAVGSRLIAEAGGEQQREREAEPPAAVGVAAVRRGPIAEHLTVAGTLEPAASIVLTPEVGGRLVALAVDIGDSVERGAVVARIDDTRYAQAVAAAEAAVATAEARLAEARSAVGVARREAERSATLVERGVVAEAQRDRAEADKLAAEAAIAVAEAQLQQARTGLAAARIDLDATAITADWGGDDVRRTVGQRWVDVGATVEPGDPVVSVLDLEPLRAAIQVTEIAYGRIVLGQAAELRTDAWPGEVFAATVARLAPRFNPDSRQALVELRVPNADGRLKPGMFVRARLELDRREDAILVPEAALVGREGDPAVFAVNAAGDAVRRVPVTLGLRDDGVIEISGEGLTDRVVVLGHHLIGDGSAIVIPDPTESAP